MKKIMFSDKNGLTQAVLDGSKTQTRRIMKGKPLFPSDEIESAGVLGDEVQIIANDGDKLVLMSRKLFRAMGFAPGRHPWFVQLARIKGTDEFVIVRRENADTFHTQCSMVTPTHRRKTPATCRSTASAPPSAT